MSTLFDLTDKTALVTGGTRGIGLMIARGLLDAGARVVITSRKADACEQARAELAPHGEVTAFAHDISDGPGIEALAADLEATHDRLHILVNNAGATWGAPLEEFPESAWDKVLGLNVKAPFLLTQRLLPLLRAAGTADDPARIINIGSIDGLRVTRLPTFSYSASKAAIHHLTRTLARDLGPQHITVNAIAPGAFESKMMAATLAAEGDAIAAESVLGRIGRPDDMAGVAVYLSSRAGSYVTGAVIPVDGGTSTAR